MARKTTTVHVCDSCGKQVERARDLTHFAVECMGRGGRRDYRRTAGAELCDACTPNLVAQVKPYGFDTESIEALIEEQGAK